MCTILRLKKVEGALNSLIWRRLATLNYNHLLDPSSVTIPRPSALFCLSKAFKSKTLDGENRERESGAATPGISKLEQKWLNLTSHYAILLLCCLIFKFISHSYLHASLCNPLNTT